MTGTANCGIPAIPEQPGKRLKPAACFSDLPGRVVEQFRRMNRSGINPGIQETGLQVSNALYTDLLEEVLGRKKQLYLRHS